MSEFEQATAVVPCGDGRYDATIVEGWDIAGNANGGYLIAMAGRAMADAVGRPPLTITAHYLSPGRVGPVTIDVDVVRTGRRMAVVRSTVLSPEHGPVMALLGTFADQPAPEQAGPSVIAAAPPELPPLADCVPAGPPVAMNDAGFGRRVTCSYHPDDTGFRTGSPTGTAVMRGWFEFADGSDVDAYGLLVALDAFAPVCFNREEFPAAWAPTLELTAHVREMPAPGPLRCVFRSHFIQNGMFEEDGEVWDDRGILVAQSRQLALIPKPM